MVAFYLYLKSIRRLHTKVLPKLLNYLQFTVITHWDIVRVVY